MSDASFGDWIPTPRKKTVYEIAEDIETQKAKEAKQQQEAFVDFSVDDLLEEMEFARLSQGPRPDLEQWVQEWNIKYPGHSYMNKMTKQEHDLACQLTDKSRAAFYQTMKAKYML